MKRGKFTPEQIIGVLKQHEAGRKESCEKTAGAYQFEDRRGVCNDGLPPPLTPGCRFDKLKG